MTRREITTDVTVTFTTHSIWPDEFPDMTLTEAMAWESDIELDDVIYDYDHVVVNSKVTKSVEITNE